MARSKWDILAHLLVGLLLVDVSWAHLRLTYPPARHLDVDFLDNARTQGPCGMPAGYGPSTTLLAGSTLNITWHLAYSHRGGYRLQILNSGGSILQSLTTSGVWTNENNPTLQHQQVTLPPNFTCEKCVFRILRNAAEWGRNYIFWSCADVDIVVGDVYHEVCSNHGQFFNGSCICDERFHGDKCQYENECESDDHCGRGECIHISQTYPKKQCFCEPGWFGLKCNQESSVKSLEFDPSEYMLTQLDPKYALYRRIIADSDEIEIVLRSNTTGYLGLGWRSNDASRSCKDYPLISSTWGQGKPSGTSSPEGEGEPTSEPEGEGEPTSEPEGEGEPTSEPEGEGEPTSEPEGESEPTSEPEGEGEPTSEPEGEGEPTSEPEGERPSANLRDMECTDITLALADENLHQVRDYYTRDRSTPRIDEVYGGSQSLTAAIAGRDEDGILTVIFRKKITATEPADFSIEDSPMHVIWARGQTPGDIYHRPTSGLETSSQSNPNFYQAGEIKYHGHGDHRGYLNLNLLDTPPVKKTGDCVGEWLAPDCDSADMSTCSYAASWSYEASGDRVTFNISARQDMDKWTGIAFSETVAMDNADVYLAWMDGENEKPFDGWIGTRYTPPTADTTNSILNSEISYVGGRLNFQFTRMRVGDDASDISFGDKEEDCFYFFYPNGGGNIIANAISKHSQRPTVSSSCIHIRSCAIPSVTNLFVSIKLLLDFDNYNSPSGFNQLDQIILPIMTNVLQEVDGFAEVKRHSYRSGSIIASLNVVGNGTNSTFMDNVRRSISNEISDGLLGTTAVDKMYLDISQDAPPTEDTPSTEGVDERDIPLIAFAAVVGFLVLLAIYVFFMKFCENKPRSHGLLAFNDTEDPPAYTPGTHMMRKSVALAEGRMVEEPVHDEKIEVDFRKDDQETEILNPAPSSTNRGLSNPAYENCDSGIGSVAPSYDSNHTHSTFVLETSGDN